MSKYKLIVVDENPDFIRSIENAFVDDEEVVIVATTTDGVEAIKKIEAYKPDVVLIDMILPNIDGLGVIQNIDVSKFPNPTKYIVISQLSTEYIITQAIQAGAHFFIKKPTNIEIIKQRIREALVRDFNPEVKSMEDKVMLQTIKRSVRALDEKINNIFLALGIPAHIKGFQYLKDSIKMVVDNPDIINYITKKLYPSVAEKNGTEAARVERAIRHAIEVSWNKGKYDNINKMFGMKIYNKLDKPTNGELIALIANKLITEGA